MLNLFSKFQISQNIILIAFLMISAVCSAKQEPEQRWQWLNRAGGTYRDCGNAIAIDDAVNCYVTGNFQGEASFGAYSLTANGYRNVFIAKMDSSGNWIWAKQADGSDNIWGSAISVDDDGNS